MKDRQTPRRGARSSRFSVGARVPVTILALAGVAALGTAASSAGQADGRHVKARAARRTIWVNEVMHGTNVSHQGNTVVHDRGYGRGTYSCAADIYMRIYYTKGFTRLICRSSSGSIEAAGKVAFFSAGPTATFTGTIPITHGTGKYAHGSGHYRVEGTVVRKTYAAEASTKGWFTY